MERLYLEIIARYEELDDLRKRLQDDYNGIKDFEQLEEDRITLCAILEVVDKIVAYNEEVDEWKEIVKKAKEKLKD